ncbi:30S ribosomal protein S21 [Burkholderia stagnalis]|uniref:Small ribosomal subunit protein bS21 n=1 Tax=Burkholderia stagnalis TaxID=1503054 RepID=A0A108JLT0_9BURK|nr:30S ribosomal protein S21 [Burkholderia stagnalis]AOK55576.1 30S ribosomal protein S21 [Burkholderia stagnalis]KAB0640198.1 30S ribosomal protein S21 [Burkholderia stagnalis]KVC58360.1 30S ribosomal protein S21 [Burkholderia stagnalis]KVD91832.1 30S ribosomal protein S21 [Burkholderia stagnalis]KVL88246.1 30S ribosomal protein S21 [Burkholderia stagnalis]
MTTILPKLNEPLEVTLRRFRREIERTGLIKELRSRTSYEKPTAERKRKKASAVARQRKLTKRLLPPRKMY